jgi:DNA invertase Pin-like site-specific DNA recombinase
MAARPYRHILLTLLHHTHPSLERLRRDIFAGKVATVLGCKSDRLGRSLKDGVNIPADSCDREIRIVAVAQQLHFNTSFGTLNHYRSS